MHACVGPPREQNFGPPNPATAPVRNTASPTTGIHNDSQALQTNACNTPVLNRSCLLRHPSIYGAPTSIHAIKFRSTSRVKPLTLLPLLLRPKTSSEPMALREGSTGTGATGGELQKHSHRAVQQQAPWSHLRRNPPPPTLSPLSANHLWVYAPAKPSSCGVTYSGMRPASVGCVGAVHFIAYSNPYLSSWLKYCAEEMLFAPEKRVLLLPYAPRLGLLLDPYPLPTEAPCPRPVDPPLPKVGFVAALGRLLLSLPMLLKPPRPAVCCCVGGWEELPEV